MLDPLSVSASLPGPIGRERARNEDCAYAGSRVLAVADGLGGHPGGVQASSAAIGAVAALESASGPGDPLVALRQVIQLASADIRALAESAPGLVRDGPAPDDDHVPPRELYFDRVPAHPRARIHDREGSWVLSDPKVFVIMRGLR